MRMSGCLIAPDLVGQYRASQDEQPLQSSAEARPPVRLHLLGIKKRKGGAGPTPGRRKGVVECARRYRSRPMVTTQDV